MQNEKEEKLSRLLPRLKVKDGIGNTKLFYEDFSYYSQVDDVVNTRKLRMA